MVPWDDVMLRLNSWPDYCSERSRSQAECLADEAEKRLVVEGFTRKPNARLPAAAGARTAAVSRSVIATESHRSSSFHITSRVPEILAEAGVRDYGPKVQYPCPRQVDILRYEILF
jgi:hypothetical protein